MELFEMQQKQNTHGGYVGWKSIIFNSLNTESFFNDHTFFQRAYAFFVQLALIHTQKLTLLFVVVFFVVELWNKWQI